MARDLVHPPSQPPKSRRDSAARFQERAEDRRKRVEEERQRAELQQAVAKISEGKEVSHVFAATTLGRSITLSVEKGYLTINGGQAKVPLHAVEFAGTEGPGGAYMSLNLFGAGTRLGQVQGGEDAVRNAADAINSLLKAVRGHQQQAVQQAREQHVPLVKCLYCGTRVQDVGRCIHCGAPLPAPVNL